MKTSSGKVISLEHEFTNPNSQGEISVYMLKGDDTHEWLELNPINSRVLNEKMRHQQYPFRLKILHFNDLHGQLSRFDQSNNFPVFSRMVSYIQKTRLEYKDDPLAGVLVFSAGDDCIGSPYDLLLRDDQGDYQQHASYHLFAKAGIAAVVPGNHDFDLGLKFLTKAIQTEGNFPVLAANLKINKDSKTAFTSAAIFCIKGIRVGVIGITTPVGSYIQKELDYEIVDPVKVVKSLLPIVRENSDLVIILSHLGNNLCSTTAPTAVVGDVELAKELPFGSVDLIIGGHTHDLLNKEHLDQKNIVNGIPITQAGSHGQYMGEVEFILSDKPMITQVCLTPIAQLPVDQNFEDQYVQPLIQNLQPFFQREIGVVEKSSLLINDFQNANLQGSESASFNFLTDNLVAYSKSIGHPVDLAVMDTTGFHLQVQPGNSFSYADLWKMLPYENSLVLIWATGDALIDLIKLNVLQSRLPEGSQQERIFFHCSKEIRYQIYENEEKEKIEAINIQMNGMPMVNDSSHEYLIATTSYFLPVLKLWQQQSTNLQKMLEVIIKNIKIDDTGLLIRDVMNDQIRKFGGINSMGGARIDGRIEMIENVEKGP